MASINVRPEFFGQPQTANKECSSEIIQQVFSQTSNVASDVISGDAIFDLSTGANEWLDLFKTHIAVQYTWTGTVEHARNENFAACCFDRAQLLLNGVKVANSDYFTQDSMLSKRLNFSETYNENINNLTYIKPAAATTYGTVGAQTSIEHLDALFLRNPDCIIPPNTHVRLILTASNDYLTKTLVSDASNGAGTTAIAKLYINRFTIIKTAPVSDGDHIVKLNTFQTFKSAISNATLNTQVMVRESCIRLAAYFQSNTIHADFSIYSATNFSYLNDVVTAKLKTLLFKYGSQQLPSRAFDNTSYGFQESHMLNMTMAEKTLDPAGGETYTSWLNQGPIYSVPVVKTSTDTSRTVELQCLFATNPAAFSYLTAVYENFISIPYMQGVPAGPTISLI